jgi:hypothetical protein
MITGCVSGIAQHFEVCEIKAFPAGASKMITSLPPN